METCAVIGCGRETGEHTLCGRHCEGRTLGELRHLDEFHRTPAQVEQRRVREIWLEQEAFHGFQF